MKRKLLVFSVILSVVFLVASVSFAGPKWTVKLGHDQPEGSPHHDAALKFKQLLEAATNGDIQVNLFPSQLLGTGIQMVEMVQAGALEFLAIPTSNLQVMQPTFQVLDLPFLFRDRDSLWRMLDGDLGDTLYKPFLKKNIVGLTFWQSGFKQFTGNFPIHTPADYKGRKIRVMPAPVLREQFKALGASPVPIDFHELYNALQQNVVEGQENPITTIVTMKFYEVQKYMALSNHAFLGYGFVTSKIFYDSLPEKYQKIVWDVSRETAKYEWKIVSDREAGFLKTIRDAGVEIIELTPKERKAFEDAMQPVYEWFVKKLPEGKVYIDMIRGSK